jgi:Tfp pilus assembly protein PilN
VKVTNVISPLDLMIEKGRTLHAQGGSALMVFEEPVVHFLFFRDGVYGFQRSFELREEGFQRDFLLEIQRSFFYTKQKFKIPIDRVTVLLAPAWLQGDITAQLQETLGFPVDFLSPTLDECESPELQLLNVLTREAASVPSFLNVLPTELKRELKTRKLCWLGGIAALVMLGVAIGWTYETRDSLQKGWLLLSQREKELRGVEAQVETEREKIDRFNQLEEEAAAVKTRLNQKRSLHLYLQALPFVVPPQVHFEAVTWGERASEMTVQPSTEPSQLGHPAGLTHIRISGKVDAESSDERYARFSELVDNLKAAPFTDKVEYQSNALLQEGLFQLDLQVKEIRSGNGAQ